MKDEIKDAIQWYLDSEYHVLDKGITEILSKTYSGVEFSLGVSFETNEYGEEVYIFNIFIDDEYINIDGEFKRNEINASLYSYLSDCWYNAVGLINQNVFIKSGKKYQRTLYRLSGGI